MVNAQAVVYYYDAATKGWAPTAVEGLCSVAIYQNPQNGNHRVIARGVQDPGKVCLPNELGCHQRKRCGQHQIHQAVGFLPPVVREIRLGLQLFQPRSG